MAKEPPHVASKEVTRDPLFADFNNKRISGMSHLRARQIPLAITQTKIYRQLANEIRHGRNFSSVLADEASVVFSFTVLASFSPWIQAVW